MYSDKYTFCIFDQENSKEKVNSAVDSKQHFLASDVADMKMKLTVVYANLTYRWQYAGVTSS
jgi:hypothetical protein